jgi:hypothetical protein
MSSPVGTLTEIGQEIFPDPETWNEVMAHELQKSATTLLSEGEFSNAHRAKMETGRRIIENTLRDHEEHKTINHGATHEHT